MENVIDLIAQDLDRVVLFRHSMQMRRKQDW